ncbi:MAG: C4-dicarboxylate ABC transporter permease [Deltaproteobacteria bacterium]|nr:MAG: C4-dicarboxylate ABC transporter permease [Deltaproteobacteria bacterium]
MEGLLLFGLLGLFVIIGVPVGIAIGVAAAIAIYISDLPLVIISLKAFAGVDTFSLLAVPFFILAGSLMSTGGIARRIIDFANTCVGFFTGGLAITTTAACMFFAAISGSAIATTSSIGTIMIPEMKKKGYDNSFSSALSAAAGTIGIIIPPSIPLVIYAISTQTSIGDLFIAGIVPGILFGISLMITCFFISKKNNYAETGIRPTVKSVFISFKKSFLALMAPVIVLGGIYTGFFTPTEASVVAVVYSLIIGTCVYKELDRESIYEAFVSAVVLNGAVCYLISLSMAFSYYLSVNHVPQAIAGFLLGLTDNSNILFLIINILLLIIGCLVDIIPAIIILAPILLPLVEGLGMTSITFGVILVANLAIGFVTPPFGLNLFVAAVVGKVTLGEMMKHVKWFIFAMIISLLVVTFYPPVTMFFVK